jgi:GMP synthase (glutamine-hydrolysing)
VGIAGIVPQKNQGNIVPQLMKQIKSQIGQDKVLLALSGGVDSTTLAYMLHLAVGSQMRAVIVDNGLMRANEIPEILEQFRSEPIEDSIVVVRAEHIFLSRLAGVTDPELKRQVIGKTFIDVLVSEGRKLEAQGFKATFLAQGTIYPDVIESGVIPGSSIIKSHHNVGGLPKNIPFELIEPFRYLFKDDVRQIANYLHIPVDIYTRKPFPGPGLAIRIIGEITEERLEIARQADYLLRKELTKIEQNKRIWQVAAILLPIRTVGVKGDNRSYEYTIALRMVDSVNGMTAQASLVPIDILQYIARQITDHVKGVNRVVYDLSSKPPATIEWE